jgi:hypothetical protein
MTAALTSVGNAAVGTINGLSRLIDVGPMASSGTKPSFAARHLNDGFRKEKTIQPWMDAIVD